MWAKTMNTLFYSRTNFAFCNNEKGDGIAGKKIACIAGKTQRMKRLLFAIVAFAAFACSDDKKTDASSTESAPVTPGIENTNGNVPDTSTTIRLNQPMPVDSSKINDSSSR